MSVIFLPLQLSSPKVLLQSEINSVVSILLIECIASKWCWPQCFLCHWLFVATGCTVGEKMWKNASVCECELAAQWHNHMFEKSPVLRLCHLHYVSVEGPRFSSQLLPLFIILVFVTRAAPVLQGIAGCYRGREVLFLFKQCICVFFVHGRSSWFYTARSPSTFHWS